jgi:hypothetical protein
MLASSPAIIAHAGAPHPGPGTPGDEQLASYLLDCRHVVSADKVFVRFVRDIGAQSPFAMPAAHLVRGGADGAADLVELVGQLVAKTKRMVPEAEGPLRVDSVDKVAWSRSRSRYRDPHSMPRGDKPCPTAYRPC